MVQWILVHSVCVIEVILFLVLCLPMPAAWQHRILKLVADQPSDSPIARLLQFTFVFLLLMFADATKDWYKLINQQVGIDKHQSVASDHYHEMKQFRAQRNSYLAFFALFLLIVLWRFYLLSKQVIKAEAIGKQASGQGKQIEKFMDAAAKGEKDSKELVNVKKEKEKLERDLETLKKQAKQQAEQYERTLDENQALQEKAEGIRSKRDD